MTYTSHNKICYACGQEKRRRQLGYDIRTLKTYCKKDCPNHTEIPNVDLVELRTEDLKDALDSYYSKELLQVFNRVLGKTVSTRPVPAMAMHLMKTAQKHDLSSISETLTFILDRDFANYEVKEDLQAELEQVEAELKTELVDYSVIVEDTYVENHLLPEPEIQPEPVEEIKIVVNEKEIEPVQEEEEEDDDEFTF